jgi:hypothetical protein
VVASAFAKLSGSKPGRHNIVQNNNMGCVCKPGRSNIMQNNYILEQRKHASSPDQIIRSWEKADGTRKKKKSLLSAMK